MPLRRWVGAAVASVGLAGCVQPGPAGLSCAAPLKPALEIDLYFGRDKSGGGEVSEAEWAAFLAEVVTPRFPDGLSVLEVKGQAREPSGRIVAERTKLVVVVVFDSPAHRSRVAEIVAAYGQRFGQHGVFRTEQPVCAGA
jgi:hypothetical protein